MADTAVRFGPTAGTGSAATLYTAGSAGAVLRSLHIANTSSSDATFKLSIGTDGAGTRLYSDTVVPANGVYDWQGYIPLANTNTVQWTGATTLTITGGVVAQ